MYNECNNIEDYNKYLNMSPPYDRTNCIVYNDKNKTYGYWIECDDYYYSGWGLSLKYCPLCGRKL